MPRSTLIENYNDMSGGVVTDRSKLGPVPENAVKYAVNFEFDAVTGATRRKALDLESGISGSDYVQLDSDLPLGTAKVQVHNLRNVLDQFGTATNDLVLATLEGKGIVYKLGDDQQLADAVQDSSVESFAIPADDYRSITWSPELGSFVAFPLPASVQPILVSSDGILWTKPRSVAGNPFVGTNEASIVWNPNDREFLAIYDNHVFKSTNGLDWVYYPNVVAGTSTKVRSAVWSPELALYMTTLNSSVGGYYSEDGISWTYSTMTSGYYRSLAWSSTLELMVGVAGTGLAGQRVVTSPDCINWTRQTTPATDRQWNDVIWVEDLGKFIAVGNTNYVLSSADGVTWSEVLAAVDANYYTSVAWSPSLSLLVAVSQDGTDRLMTSSNGTTWTAINVPASEWKSVEWSEELGKFVAVAASGTYQIMTSTDGTTWEASDSSSLINISPTEFAVHSGVALGTTNGPELSVLYNTDANTYKFTATTALGCQPLIRDFEGVYDGLEIDERPDVMAFTISALSGTHTGANNAATLTDSAAAWVVDALVGLTISNTTDGSSGTITANTATTITATLAGGTDNDWDTGDAYTINSTFTEGEDIRITDGTTTRRFRIIDKRSATEFGVDKSLVGTDGTAFDGADPEDYSNWSIVGIDSLAAGSIASHTGTGLSDTHRYNLINQGWTQAYADEYAKDIGKWPSNAQVWYAGRDASNNFSPAELDKVSFGNSHAPQGHVILNPFKKWRHAQVPGVWQGAMAELTYDRGFTTICKFGSRVAMSGASIGGVQNTVYISPILTDQVVTADDASLVDVNIIKFLRFYQVNDPTADVANDLLPNDGLTITVKGADRIYKLVELGHALLVIADNGVWTITGSDLQTGFRSDSFAVNKIAGAAGPVNTRTVVTTESSVLYWANNGIYNIGQDERGRFVWNNIVKQNIEALYREVPIANRASAISYYDSENHRIYWAYNTDADTTTPELRNGLLVMNLDTGAFYPLRMSADFADSGGDLSDYKFSINGFTQDPAFPASDGTVPLKLIIGEHYNDSGQADIKHSIMEFNNGGTDDFYDFALYRNDVHSLTDTVEMADTYIDTWDDTLGDTSRRKQGIWVFCHMKKTETGWEDIGGGALAPIGVSGLTMQSRWDWHNSNAGGKWGTAKEIYRHKRPYIPVDDTDTYDTGESVLTTKNKIYGRGRALSLRFTAQDGKDAQLLGYAIPYSIENAP